MDRSTLKLNELTDTILSQMDASGFMESTRGFYVTLFHRLCHMVNERGDDYYTIELSRAFNYITIKNRSAWESVLFQKQGQYSDKCKKHVVPLVESACFYIVFIRSSRSRLQ